MCASVLAERLAREGLTYTARRHATAYAYCLLFDKRSSMEKEVGYANIRSEPGSCVEGTLNEVDNAGMDLLDRIELVPTHYRRELIEVRDSATGANVRAYAYLAQPAMIDATTRPRRDYIERLAAAADVLPPAYVSTLLSMACLA